MACIQIAVSLDLKRMRFDMKRYVIKTLDEREDGNNYLFDSSPRAIDWTSLFYAKKFDTETEAEIYIKKNFILRSQVIAIQVGR